MAFEVREHEPLDQAICRIVIERIDKAHRFLANGKRGAREEAIHEARKQFKQIRGILRLIREELGSKTFRKENKCFRDMGRPLSDARDADVMLEAFDRLLEQFKHEIKPKHYQPLRQLVRQLMRPAGKIGRSDKRNLILELSAAKERVRDWKLDHFRWPELRDGLRQIYRQSRKAMKAAEKECTDEAFHEWRKRSKDLRYALELASAARPQSSLDRLADQAHSLSNLLGDDHDLAVLRLTLEGLEAADHVGHLHSLLNLIERRRAAFQAESVVLGNQLLKRKADQFIEHVKDEWDAA
jgi:CHAD domain-containing protein